MLQTKFQKGSFKTIDAFYLIVSLMRIVNNMEITFSVAITRFALVKATGSAFVVFEHSVAWLNKVIDLVRLQQSNEGINVALLVDQLRSLPIMI